MTIDPSKDGVDHINVYSKGQTELGRMLSNFAPIGFTGPSGITYQCVEAWWYYIVTGRKYPHLAKLTGFKAKQEGRNYPRVNEVDEDLLFKAYLAKLDQNPKLYRRFMQTKLPFTHYYVYGGKVIQKHAWTGDLWNAVKDYINGIHRLKEQVI